MQLKMQLQKWDVPTSTAYIVNTGKIMHIIFLMCLVAILLGSLTPIELSSGVAGNDKLQHVLAYALTAFCGSKAGFSKPIFLCAALFVISGSIELIQPYVGRAMSLVDMIANAGGLFIGSIAVKCLSFRSVFPVGYRKSVC